MSLFVSVTVLPHGIYSESRWIWALVVPKQFIRPTISLWTLPRWWMVAACVERIEHAKGCGSSSGLCWSRWACKGIWFIQRLVPSVLSMRRDVDYPWICDESWSMFVVGYNQHHPRCITRQLYRGLWNIMPCTGEIGLANSHLHQPLNNICAHLNRIVTMRIQTPALIKATLVSQQGGL